MVRLSLKRLPLKAALAGAALLALVEPSVRGQYPAADAYPMAGGPSASTPPFASGAGGYQLPAANMTSQPYGTRYSGSAGMCPPSMPTYPAMPAVPPQQYFGPPHPCLPGPVPPTPGQPGQPSPTPQPEQRPSPTPQPEQQPSPTPRPEQQPPESQRPEQQPSQTQQPEQQPSSTGQFDATGTNAGQDTSLPGEQGAAGGGGSVALAAPGGYLENPIPITTFRLRFDAAYNLNRPDRAEYFYGAWQELGFHPHGIQGNGVFFDPKAKGPNLLPSNVNYWQPEAYMEYAFMTRFSAFVQVPYRIINFRGLQEDNPESEMKRNPADAPGSGSPFFPEPRQENEANPQTNFNNFSDLQFGFKAAILASPDQFLTFQLRTYSPTGNASLGLGTGHWSLEPSLLYYLHPTQRLVFQAQLTDWTPIGGGEAGNIFEYGAGLGYAVYQRRNFAIMPITEFLGWTVLNGYESLFAPISATAPPGLELPQTHGVEQAGGNTIVNGKIGVRVFWGEGQSLYVGYGRALTGTHWYTDDFRLEYRVFFGRNRAFIRPL